MSIPLTGTGGLFTRLGKIGGLLAGLDAWRGDALEAGVEALFAQFAASDQDVVDGLFGLRDAHRAAAQGLAAGLRSLAATVAARTVGDAAPQADPSAGAALLSLVRQMRADGDSVAACAVTAAVAAAAGTTSDAAWVVDCRTATGYACENALAETLTATCTADAGTGATAGSEPVAIRGLPAVGPLDAAWPAGSGASAAVRLVDAAVEDGSGPANALVNGTFESFAAGLPDAWHVHAGAAGTTILQGATAFLGSSSLELRGDGSTDAGVYQDLGVDTSSAPGPLTRLAWSLRLAVDATPASGTLEVALTDAAGTVVEDESGAGNVATFALAGAAVAPSWGACSGCFRTPRKVPAPLRFRIRLSVPLPAGRSAFVDHAAAAVPVALYAQGPAVAAFAGAAAPLKGDGWTIAVANDQAGAWQRLFDRLFDMRSLGLLLPSSADPTIAAGLIG